MKRLIGLMCVGAMVSAANADPNYFYIEAFAPETVMPGETFTVEFWGRVEHLQFIPGYSLYAGFGISALGVGNIQSLTNATFYGLNVGTSPGVVVGYDLIGVIGGQLPNIFFGPPLDYSHPIRLFSIDVTAGESGSIMYTPGLPNPNGALTFFPVGTAAASINNNAPGSTLVLTGATTRIIPGPGAVAVCWAGLAFASRRARREASGERRAR